MRIVLLGPPGSGKGTQSIPLANFFSILPLSTGDMLRSAIEKKTEIGLQVQSLIESGALIPDNDIVRLVTDRLLFEDASRGFVLDGFPRTLEQAKVFDSFLEEQGLCIDIVFEFKVTEAELVRRILQRSQDARNQGMLSRSDDSLQIISERLKIYREKTLPIVDYYAARGVLFSINAMQSVERITESLIHEVQKVALEEKSSVGIKQ
jgi:adenylate kinase